MTKARTRKKEIKHEKMRKRSRVMQESSSKEKFWYHNKVMDEIHRTKNIQEISNTNQEERSKKSYHRKKANKQTLNTIGTKKSVGCEK